MSVSINTLSSQSLKVSHAAHSLNSIKRQEIGIQAIGGYTPISHVADRYGVSRKFVYQQKEKALDGIAQAFDKPASKDGEKVLFYIPVTRKWLMQVLLALIFICRASYQGVIEFFRDILNYEISKGTVHNIISVSYTHLDVYKRQALESCGDPLRSQCNHRTGCCHSSCCLR